MRIRERNKSTQIRANVNVHESGVYVNLANGSTTSVNVYHPGNGALYQNDYGFFIDEPTRSRKRKFGFANRWEENSYPNSADITVNNRNFSLNGNNYTPIEYTPYNSWITVDPSCGNVRNDLTLEKLYGPWVYRWRSRLSLNNAVQTQRQRMFAYNGDLSETFAELPECPNLFRLINMSKGLRHNLSGLALGIKFGWAPLFSTFQLALSELAAWKQGVAAMRRRSGIQTLRYTGSDSWDLTIPTPTEHPAYSNGSTYGYSRQSRCVSHKGEITYTAVVDMRPYYSADTWDLFSRLSKVGGLPSLRTLWELIPRSFLVDWFVSIGDVISDIQGNLLYDINVKQQCWSWKIHDRIARDLVWYNKTVMIGEKDIRAFYRSETPPLGSWKVPKILPGLSSGQISTLGILVAQAMKRDTKSLNVLLRRLNRVGYR